MSDALVPAPKLASAANAIAASGELAQRWAQARARRTAWDACRSWRDLFREVLGPQTGRVLEVECGDGDATFLLHVLGHQVHGADSSADRVRRLQARAHAACAAADFRTSEPADLRFPAGAFDAVHARGLFAAAARPGDLLLEWYRVLRSGGTAVVIERDGRARPGDLLRTAGFVGVRERAAQLPRRCLPGPAREPWYRRILVTTASFRVAWGTRP